MVPTTIYHYTSLEAFEKIIETGRIRATHYSHFGDKKELQLGVQLLLDTLKRHSIESCDREYRDFLVEGIKAFAEGQLSVFVLSLTETCDSAYHWRQYAPSGVAIGFCRDRVRRGFPIDISRRVTGVKVENPVRPDPANRFMQCRYVGSLDLPEIISKRFFSENSYPAAFRNEHVRANAAIYACLAVSIYQTISAIKGDGFVQDAEWRCVHINPDPDMYPVKTENNRTFIQMQFTPQDFVREVWVGPHDQCQKCNDVIETLRGKGLLHCKPSMSKLASKG